jgi:hypothetical protein
LSAYPVVIITSGDPLADPVALGNVLADYVDAGGKVIEAVASFATGFDGPGPWELSGRIVSAGYEPFTHGPPDFDFHDLGAYNAAHPLMENVTALSDQLPAAVGLRAGADLVGSWDNGVPVVATQGDNVVGINIYVYDSGAYGGDVAQLFRNAVVWLATGSVPPGVTFDVYFDTVTPPLTKIASDLTTLTCNPGALAANTIYHWQVVAKGAGGATPGAVWSFTTGPSFSGDEIWIDFGWPGVEVGIASKPFDTLAEGVTAVNAGGTLMIKAGSTTETLSINKPMRIEAVGGSARLGGSGG